MSKAVKAVSCILFIGFVILSSILYVNNNNLKVHLGGLYHSNIANYKLNVLQIAEYLENEKSFNENDLRNLYYKANMLMAIELPNKNIISLYETQITHYISLLEGLISEDNDSEEIETAKNNALQLLGSLEDGLEDMLSTGLVQNKDGTFREDSKAYYELSLADSRNMRLINESLQKTIEPFFQTTKPNP